MRRITLLYFLPFFLLFACGEDNSETNSAKQNLLNFLSVNKNIALFGKFDIKGVLNKSKCDELPKVGVFMDAFKEVYRYTKMDDSLFFASEVLESGQMNFYYLVNITNRDSLVEFFRGMGLSFEDKEALMVYESSPFSIAINQDVCAIGMNDLGLNIAERTRQLLKEKVGTKTNATVLNKILSANGDLVVGFELRSLFLASYGSVFGHLKEDDFLENNFIQTSVNFNNGEINLKTQNFFANNLKTLSLFKSSDGEWAHEIVRSNKGFGIALNLNVGELIHLAQSADSSTKEKISILQLFGNNWEQIINEFSKIWDGTLTYSIRDLPNTQKVKQDFELFVGLGDGGQQLLEWFKLMYNEEDFDINKVRNGIVLSSKSKDPIMDLEPGLDSRFKFFGKKGVTGFVDFSKWKEVELTNGIKMEKMNELDYASFEMDDHGSNLSVFIKDKSRNVLEIIGEIICENLFVRNQIFM
jgi:hypothetical protein